MDEAGWLGFALTVAIVGAIAAWLASIWYRSSPGRPLATVEVDGTEPFSFTFPVGREGTHRIWLRSRFQKEPGAKGSPPKIAVALRVVVFPPAGEQRGYRDPGGGRVLLDDVVTAGGKSQWSESPQTGSVRQVQTLWIVPEQPLGSEISVEGACRPDALPGYATLEIFAARR